MKNIKIVLSALIITLFSSCQDAIDITQPGELLPETTFQTVEDLQKGLWGVYPRMSGIGEVAFSSIFTDEVKIGFANGGQGLIEGEYGFVLNSTSSDPLNIWGANYGLINAANRVIEAADKIQTSGPETEQKNDIVAQLRIMRAFAHFKLVSYFSEDPTDDSALGVIKLDIVPTLNDHLPRVTNGEIYAFIEEDLAFAEENLVTNADNSLGNTYVSLDFVTALRARMAAYRGKYDVAGGYADQLIAKYPLSDPSTYLNIWFDEEQSDEVIFKFDHIKDGAKIGATWASVDASIEGSPFYTMSTDLYDLLNNPDDIRFSAFIHGSSDPTYNSGNKGKIAISKYTGSGAGALINDEKIFRVSEMYFIKAEAYAFAKDYANVAATLQLINVARFTGDVPVIPVPADEMAAWAEILKQRRIELCYEGHRYLDLKRLGVKAGVNIQRSTKDCAINGACFLSNTDHRFTLPIPNAELSANPAIAGQQNTGY